MTANLTEEEALRLGGVSEVADELGISPQRMRQLRASGSFPAPVAELSMGPLWDLDEIANYRRGRRGPGRPPKSLLGGRFALEETPMGVGGFADVFRAADLDNAGDYVAVKILRQAEHHGEERFMQELRLLEDIDHPNVVAVLAHGVDSQGRPWYAMPLAVGNLQEELPDFAHSANREREIYNVISELCAGLAAIHALGIYHRDLCPANVLLTSEGRWAISDFGLAREAERRSTALTQSSIVLGHVVYLSPEQLSGLKHAEGPSDIYSLGRILHALVTGADPIIGDSYDGDSTFRSVIKRATKQKPTDRYPTVEALLDDINKVYKAPVEWEGPDQVLERLGREMLVADIPTDTLEEYTTFLIDNAATSVLASHASLLMPRLTKAHIEWLFQEHRAGFRGAVAVWSQSMQDGSFEFSFCDQLADFGARAVEVTKDDAILESVILGLVELGAAHNRYHVRATVVSILQQVADRDQALIAVNALRAASRRSVAWTLTPFTRRSFHPILREGIDEILDTA